MYIEIKKSLLAHKLKEALDKLTEFASTTDNWQIKSEIDNLKTTYSFMLQYAAQGVEDPERNSMYYKIYRSAFILNERIKVISMLETGNTYLSRKYLSRKNNTQSTYSQAGMSLDTLREELKISINNGDDCKNIYQKQQSVIDELFNQIWIPVLWTKEEYEQVIAISDSLSIPNHIKAVMISAACLSLIYIFDPLKLKYLVHMYTDGDNAVVTQRALTGIIVCLHQMNVQIEESYPEINKELSILKDIPHFLDDVYTVILQFILSLETENIDKKMRDEIIPSIMKSTNLTEPINNISEVNIEDFTEMNPQWKENIEKIREQVKELDILRQEGADTNMCTFSQLKRYPFFNEAAHWFYIFNAEVPEVYEMKSNTGNNYASFIDTLNEATDMCNSDRFSLFLTFRSMPSLPIDAMNSGLSAQNKMNKEQQNMANMEKVNKQTESRHFIQDMYRFCKLWGYEKDRIDLFNENLTVWDNKFIHDCLEENGKIKSLADYLFAKEHIQAALKLYQNILPQNPLDVEVFQKIGYAYIKNNDYANAVKALNTANMLDPNNEWTLKNLALCYKKSNKPEDAVKYLLEAEKLNPESIQIINQIGQTLITIGKYEEAIKYMFKVEYLTDGRTSSQRAIAWCYFMTDKLSEAISMYRKVTEKPDVKAEDWINLGHVFLVNNDMVNSISCYKKACEYMDNKTSFSEQFSKDTDTLLSKGVTQEIIFMLPDMVSI